MKNNLIGILISALLHAGIISWALGMTNEPIKKIIPAVDLALTISQFQAEIVPPPIPKPIQKVVTPTTPLEPEFADLPPIVKEEKVKPIATPLIKKVVENKPKEVVKAVPKLALLKPAPVLIKPKKKLALKKKPIKKKEPKIVKKPTVKKRIVAKKAPKRRVKKKKLVKKVIVRKVIKKPIRKKLIKRPVRRVVVRKAAPVKKVYRRPVKRVVARAQKPRPQRVATPQRRVVATRKMQKTGGVYRKSTPRVAKKTALRATQARKRQVSPSHTVKRVNSNQNAALSKQYKARLQRLIAAKKRYPKRAKRRGHQGRVTVSFKVTHSGQISQIKIINPAPYKELNVAAIKAIQQASRSIAYPKGMNKKSLNLTITLSYVLS